MTNKKELNDEDLDKVTGGGATNTYDTKLLLDSLGVKAGDDQERQYKPVEDPTLDEQIKNMLEEQNNSN